MVLGAGPAGATVALNLAPFRRVLVLEQNGFPVRRIGESLPAAARRLLSDMGLWEGFLADGHRPCFARTSTWGGSDPVEANSVFDPDGHGWQLDRARFDARLRATAAARGAVVLAPARAQGIERDSEAWRLTVLRDGCRDEVRTRLVIDARGRSALPLPATGATRHHTDRLVCGWVCVASSGSGGLTGTIYTEAESDGWWYTALLPGNRRVLAFHTDADRPAAADASCVTRLLARASRLPALAMVLAGAGALRVVDGGFCAAHACRLEPAAGPGWFAVGDACLAFDPISSQGLLNALYTGLAAAEACHRVLSGDKSARGDYETSIARIWQVYRRRLPAWYGQEQRWADRPFWQRRAGPQDRSR